MRLTAIFVITLAVSVILSATATWGLTYTTSYTELQDMADGFVGLATASVNDFGRLVWQLLDDSSTLVSGLLAEDYNRSMYEMNETQRQLLETTLQLMAQTENATAQAQGLVAALVVSFGSFMQSVIADFEAMGTDYATRLRTESASRAGLIFNDMIQSCITGIQRPSRLYRMGMLNVSRPADQPMDSGACTLMGALCSASSELGISVYVGTPEGASIFCDATDIAYSLVVHRGAAADTYTFLEWAPYIDSNPSANFSSWRQTCMTVANQSFENDTCLHGAGMQYPNYCNATCGFDPRCRPWYTIQDTYETPRTKMSAVYIDVYKNEAVVTLSFPLYSASGSLVLVGATDFYFSKVDTYLRTLSTSGASEVVAVAFNSSDLVVVGSSEACPTAVGRSSGVPMAQSCDPKLQQLGVWLGANRAFAGNASVELGGYLWDVFPAVVDSFAYFVIVGMNKTEVYAVITAASLAANRTLLTLSQQQTARMAAVEAAALAQMRAVEAEKVASLRAMQAQLTLYMQQEFASMEQTFNASRQQSAAKLSQLTSSEMTAITGLEDYHLSRVKNSIGVTFGSVVGIFAAILLLGSYGTWAITKQVQRIAEVIEDVAFMRVEHLEMAQKSCIREVQRIEVSLVVLVDRLAEYKSYMPAGLFQAENAPPPEEACLSPDSPPHTMRSGRKSDKSPHSESSSPSPRRPRKFSATSLGSHSVATSRSSTATRRVPVVGCARLLRRSAVVMAVNVVRFQAEAAHQLPSALRRTLRHTGMVGRTEVPVAARAAVAARDILASLRNHQAQGNVDAIVGDQLLVTFNAHFTSSDPCTAASNVALEVKEKLKEGFPWRVQIGLAAGPVYAGHLGYVALKTMLAMGPPMKVASMLAHLSGFAEPVVVACPWVEERIKYHFALQPADLVALPTLGEHVSLYSKSMTVFVLEAQVQRAAGSQEWLYEVGADDAGGKWKAMFQEVVRAASVEKAREDLSAFVADHQEEPLARRLLGRLALWQPRVGIVLAERPDAAGAAPTTARSAATSFQLSLSEV